MTFPISTIPCGRLFAARRNCSSRASCARIAALDLLRADYTFLNERLALHYGIRIEGQPLQACDLAERQRAPRPARAWEHSHADVISGPHITSRPR